MSAKITSIQVGRIRTEGDEASKNSMRLRWTTGFYKFPVPGPVRVHFLGIDGDEIADSRYHGGVNKAVLAYSAAHYPVWNDELESADFSDPDSNECGRDAFGCGAFAENLTIAEQTEGNVCIGDRFRVGDREDAVVLEVSQPREPCWKISRRWKHKTLTKRVAQTGRTGWYLRVLREGMVNVGDGLTMLQRPHPSWTIERASHILFGKEVDRFAVAELMEMPELSPEWKKSLS